MSKHFLSAIMALSTLACVEGNYVFGQVATPPDQRATRKADGKTEIDQNSDKSLGERAREGIGARQPGVQANVNPNGVQVQVGQAQGRMAGVTQHDLAALLTICNQGEVSMSQIGVDRSKNADVKKFAEEMVKAHTEMLGKIQQADAGHAAQANANAAAGTVGRRAASVDADSPIVSLHREIAAQCAQSTQEELGKKDGAEFDKCFMGAQLGAHMHAIDTMKVFQRHATGELRQVLDEGVQAATSHLEHAKGIMKSLETAAK